MNAAPERRANRTTNSIRFFRIPFHGFLHASGFRGLTWRCRPHSMCAPDLCTIELVHARHVYLYLLNWASVKPYKLYGKQMN